MGIQIYKADLMSYVLKFSNKMKQYFLEVTPTHASCSVMLPLHSLFSLSSELIHLSWGTNKKEKKKRKKKSITLGVLEGTCLCSFSSEELQVTTSKPPEFLTSVPLAALLCCTGFSPVCKRGTIPCPWLKKYSRCEILLIIEKLWAMYKYFIFDLYIYLISRWHIFSYTIDKQTCGPTVLFWLI